MRRNWIKVALAVSLAMNLLVAGAVAGALLSGGGLRGAAGGPPELRAFSTGLAPERRAALRERLRGDAVLRGGRGRLREARGGLVAALRADPFEPEALRAALAAQRSVQAEMVGRALDALIETASEMSPAERAALADALERRRRLR